MPLDLPHTSLANLRVGLIGGTFDPVHLGHLVIAEHARHERQLDLVVFVPAKSPPHKQGRDVTPAEHRLAMVNLAVAANPCFFGSRIELEREGPSYSVLTLRDFLAAGAEPDRLFFITGGDAMLDILTWHRHEEAIRLATFLAAARPG